MDSWGTDTTPEGLRADPRRTERRKRRGRDRHTEKEKNYDQVGELTDLLPLPFPEGKSCTLTGNCSIWLRQLFILCTSASRGRFSVGSKRPSGSCPGICNSPTQPNTTQERNRVQTIRQFIQNPNDIDRMLHVSEKYQICINMSVL